MRSLGVKVTASFFNYRKRILGFSALLCAALLMGWSGGCGPAFDSSLSVLAQNVLRASSQPFRVARGGYAAVYATHQQSAAALLEEADYAIAAIAQRLRVKPPEHAVRIFFVSEPRAWSVLVDKEGFRPDSVAVNVHDEIFLKDDPEQAVRPDRLAHELVHSVLREAYGAKIPLWLDEGLAGRLGLSVSQAYRAERGRRVSGEWPRVLPDLVEPLYTLTSRQTLPADSEAARAFYRASEELLASIEELIGSSALPSYIASVATGANWRVALDSRLKGSPLTSDTVEQGVRRRVSEPRKF